MIGGGGTRANPTWRAVVTRVALSHQLLDGLAGLAWCLLLLLLPIWLAITRQTPVLLLLHTCTHKLFHHAALNDACSCAGLPSLQSFALLELCILAFLNFYFILLQSCALLELCIRAVLMYIASVNYSLLTIRFHRATLLVFKYLSLA